MLGVTSSFVNNKNKDNGARTHDQITLPLSFSLTEVLSDIFSCRSRYVVSIVDVTSLSRAMLKILFRVVSLGVNFFKKVMKLVYILKNDYLRISFLKN